MGDSYAAKIKGRWHGTGVGTSVGVTVTQAAPANAAHRYGVKKISASGDAAAIVTVESPAATVLWRKRFAAAFNTSESFDLGELEGAAGQALVVKVSASTSASELNVSGVTL